MQKTLDFDPVTGTQTLFHASAMDDEVFIESRQDVEPVMEMTKALYNAHDGERYKDMTRVAAVPFVAFHEWLQRLWGRGVAAGAAYQLFTNDEQLMRRFLNDRDNLAWRTRPGVV